MPSPVCTQTPIYIEGQLLPKIVSSTCSLYTKKKCNKYTVQIICLTSMYYNKMYRLTNNHRQLMHLLLDIEITI